MEKQRSTDGGQMTLEEYIRDKKARNSFEKNAPFDVYLYRLMNQHGFEKNSDLYERANVSKQSFSDMVSGKKRPSLNTLLKLVFALRLSNRECKYLLKKQDYTLPSSSKSALVVRYCLDYGIYDLWKINELLRKENCEQIE